MEANDAYALGHPKIDQLEVKFIPDSNTVIANLLAGTVDVTLGASFSLENGRQILGRMPGAGMYLAPRGAINAFPQFLNTDPPIVLNLQFRRALLHAADRQAMVDNLMFGQTDIAHSFVNPVEAVYRSVESSIVRYDYDQRRAGELVEGLGYTRGGDGMFRNPAGQTIQLRVDVQGGRGDPTEKSALALVDNWRQVGVDAEVFVIPTALQDNAEFRSTFPAFDLARRGNYRFSLYSVLGSTEAPLPENRFRGGNRGRYMSAELDALIERHDGSISERDRNALLGQIVHHVTDQAVLVGLFFDLDATVHSERMQNITGFAERTTQAWNAHLWDVK
ncbi:MAG: hypothetical protein HW416_3403 [Chloroflexi bacterium]|nr:hypothetical protein [Chloroflexota bacterium]